MRFRTQPRHVWRASFFSTLSTFGTAVDITLAELSIEAFYPPNAHTAMRLLREIDPGVAG